jgi:quercetin dioxygenase-like cupin family protein
MFQPQNADGYKSILDKIRQKTLVYGQKTLLAEFRLAKGAVVPAHQHPHEQTGYLVSGRLELTIGGQCHLVTPGGSWCIAGNVTHSALALEDAVAVEAFSPVRNDYLP